MSKPLAAYLRKHCGAGEEDAADMAVDLTHLADMHALRLRRAKACLDQQDEPEEDYSLSDCLADLMHYCDEKGWDFAALLESAKGHYDCEVEGEVY